MHLSKKNAESFMIAIELINVNKRDLIENCYQNMFNFVILHTLPNVMYLLDVKSSD